MVTMILPILTVLCLIELNTASGISEIESHGHDIVKKSECPWSYFGTRFNLLKTDVQTLTRKMDSLTEKMEKMDVQAQKVEALTNKMDTLTGKMDALTGKMDAQTGKMDTLTGKMDAITGKMDALTGKMDKALNRKECPAGFNYLPEIDQCLRLNTDQLTWTQAHDACRRMAQGGNMVTITDSAKSDAVQRYLEKQFQKQETAVCIQSVIPSFQKMAWFGGQRRIPNRCDTPYVWKYKPGVEVPFAFTKWVSGQPDCGGNNEHCVHIASGLGYGWNDIPCSWTLCSVCEI